MRLNAQFRGLNTDLSPTHVPSGTSDVALNVLVERGELKKRMGFHEWCPAFHSADAVLSLHVAHFADGQVWVVGKSDDDDAELYGRRVDNTIYHQADLAAGADVADAAIYTTSYALTLEAIYIETLGAPEGVDDDNTVVITIKDTDGNTIVEKTYDTDNQPPTSGRASLGALDGTHKSLADEEAITMDVVQGATADMPAFKIHCLPAFVKIETAYTHNAADPGWSFMWADRFHYFDRAGGSRWHPDYNVKTGEDWGTAYKAGLPTPVAPVISATTEGAKEGWYHIHCSYFNSVTGEESIISSPGLSGSSVAIECRTGESPDISSAVECTLTAANAITETTGVRTHDADQRIVYSSLGNTEHMGKGSVELYSYKVYRDAHGSATTLVCRKGDSELDRTTLFSNAGGEPGGAKIGCVGANQGVFGQVWRGAALVEGKIEFSIPGYPTMVPRRQQYSITGSARDDIRYIYPRPWVGELFDIGDCSAMAYGGGAIAAYTPTSTWELTPDASNVGKLRARLIDPSKGCAGHQGAVGTVHGVHSIGYRSWTLLNARQYVDIAKDRFSTTLAEIPANYQTSTRMAYYGYENQVWAAVVKDGATVAQRILVWDPGAGGLDRGGRPEGALTIFDVAGLGATEKINCMVELAIKDATPTMLVGTSEGRILEYPSPNVGDENSSGTATHYVAQWRGYFGQERGAFDQHLSRIEVHAGVNVADDVTLGLRAMLTGEETRTQTTYPMTKDSGRERVSAVDLATVHGHLFQVELSSLATVTTQWKVHGLTLLLDRTDKA